MKKVSLFLLVLYNIVGTISICSVYPTDKLYGFFGYFDVFIVLLTMPITLFSFIYRYANSEELYPVLIIQSLILLGSVLLWIYLSKIFSKEVR